MGQRLDAALATIQNLSTPHFPPSLPTLNLNLPPPPHFSGLIPSELSSFKIKVSQYIYGNATTYNTAATQIMCAGALLIGPASQWYESQIDLTTMQIPGHYTLPLFLQELGEFFGAGETLDSRERSLISLRQVGTVSQLAISFQNLTNTFSPRWPDHPLIYTFSQKLKEAIRFQLTSQGSLPTIFREYVAAAIAVEQNQAAAAHSRNPSHLPNPNPKNLLSN